MNEQRGHSRSPFSEHARVSIENYIRYLEGTQGCSSSTIRTYEWGLRRLSADSGIDDLRTLRAEDVVGIRTRLARRGLSDSWHAVQIRALSSYLRFVRNIEGTETGFNLDLLRAPRMRKREVVYLSPVEVEKFCGAIKEWRYDGLPMLAGFRLRALIELLLGSAMRISEALSLNRTQVDLEMREMKIIGKGGKERIVFITRRAMEYLYRYLAIRGDQHEALFCTLDGKRRADRRDLTHTFHQVQRRAGITKRVTPHILRHTAATQMLFNGCPIGHIQAVLGHEHLETTCRFYLGTDKKAVKEAHEKYLRY